jgi:hypothetical protein
MRAPVALGVDGVTGEPLWVDALEDGPAFSVTGERRSGRSNTLMVIGRMAADAGWEVVGTSLSKASPLAQPHAFFKSVAIHELDRVLEGLHDRVLVLIDDFHRRLEADELKYLKRITLAVIAGTAASMDSRGNVRALGLTPPRNGIALKPRLRSDVEALAGLRFETIRPEFIASPRDGVGVMSIDGEARQIVVPIDPEDALG